MRLFSTLKNRSKEDGILFLMLFCLFLIAIYFPLFYHLDYLPIRLYDEARRAVNALEMAHNWNFIVTYYDGEPDMWGKPPLPIWFMAISMHLFGFDELGLRLPSALTGLGVVLTLVYFSKKYLQDYSLGLIAGLILVTSGGFIREHVVRTADYDVYLCLWTLLYTLSFFLYTEASDEAKRRKYLYASAAFITLAVLTKSVAGLFFVPGMAVFALVRGKVGQLLRSRHSYFALMGILFFVGGYYLLRNHLTPYYINTVMHNEVTGRFFNAMQGHDHGPFFYAENIFNYHFHPWIYLLFPGIILGLAQKGKLGRLSILLVLNCLILFSVISFSKTQLSWYDAPLFPLFAVLTAIPLNLLFQRLAGVKSIPNWKNFSLGTLFLLTLFAIPYFKTFQTIYKPERNWKQHEKELYGYYIRNHPNLDHYFVCNIGYNAASKFYIDNLNRRGYTIGRFHPLKTQPPEAILLICEQEAKKTIREVHHIYPLMEWKRCELIKVTGNKRDYQVNVKELEENKKAKE